MLPSYTNTGSLRIKNESRWVITYSARRARKDAANRNKGVERLKEQIRGGRLTKESINNRGYNKFLTIQGEATIRLDEDKIKKDVFWDGLKGYVTNTELSIKKVTETYVHLWQIEKAFRISKTDLRVRPIYHYLRRRIEAHVCIAFAAYTIYKELESLLKQRKLSMSPAVQHGFMKYTVTPNQISAQFVNSKGGNFMDRFTITSPPSLDNLPPASPKNLQVK